MVTALKILRAFPTDHYKILRVEPFSHINAVKKQYKALALVLHPDKAGSLSPAAGDAFKRVADSFHFLSDRSHKRDYDTSLPVETFWTACLTCRLLHEFDRRYIGYRLVCPNCRRSFRAVEAPSVEDSDFYDFDNDRTEKCFAKGQIWAIYDDDDGMPRHYGLIEEIVSSSPFRVKISWLDVQVDGDESLLLWEKSGHHVSFGRFKVGRKVEINSVNLFSHVLECEKAAKELYRIYPKKGSIWALYYDIAVFLTSYSEIYGLSMGYLEKVEGYKTIFKRIQIGAHAVRWLEKDEVMLFSHQVPSRKLTETDGMNLPGDCWELDPASLPADLLQVVR
ncbi:hypothetical protein KSP39_PZI008119 [Platanthera zijinensis]|uniref:J domain-containing protein n=1 Tax=Platanthera zijinensis TaxID=2320716 RepID=A0AAP0BPQ2_9ASPA